MTFDPWTQVTTRRGFPADEVISALQKEIRRGHTENAALLAYELATTSRELEQKMWDRLCIISVEDIGFGDVSAPVLIEALDRLRQRFQYGEGDRTIFAIHAVRYLSGCSKDRGSDEMLNWMRMSDAKPESHPVIPDYAIDMHTRRGIELGRGTLEFWNEGSRVAPELAKRETTYRKRILKVLDAGPAGRKTTRKEQARKL
jgi:replication-associated recombination protein RarA